MANSLSKLKRKPISLAAWAGLGFYLTLLWIIAGWATELPTTAQPASATEEITRHVRTLAADEMMGRGVGTPGIDLARDYIAAEFRQSGLLPGGNGQSYLQRLEVVTGVEIKQPSAARIAGLEELNLDADWIPLGLSGSGAVGGELVFVGYGITAKEYGYDDYAGIDARGKIVLALRYEPPPTDGHSPFRRPPDASDHAALRTKVANAQRHGALGLILVDLHPTQDGEDELIPTRRSIGPNQAGMIAVQLRRDLVERRLSAAGLSLRELKDRIDREGRPHSLPIPNLKISLQVTLEKTAKPADNVVALLPGADPKLKSEYIVVGAHYDHIGFGYFGTRDSSTEGHVHNGADDNASGTALMLNLAARLARLPQRPARSIAFVAFTGEELGLYGSGHFVNPPPFPLASVKTMINLDMVGRLRDNRVTVGAGDLAKELREMVGRSARDLQVEMAPGGGRSDHASFQRKQIPALHIFTGTHADYHRPSDDWEKLNIEGIAKVGDMALSLVRQLAETGDPAVFARSIP